ncbi:MAG: glycosyltransferase [Azonexus sp.]
MTNPIAIFTIVSNNYLHFARTLMQSVATQHPDAKRYCVIVDIELQHAQILHQELATIALNELQLPGGEDFLFQYSVLELNTAVKPWAFEHLLQRGHEQVIYIDPDIRLYQPLSEVLLLLKGNADVVLTPHLLAPIDDTLSPSELDIRRAGTYNLGFCAVRNSANTCRYLQWWQGKLQNDCIIALDKGIFVDQSWMDLTPGMFENVVLLRHPGYNVAYWNLGQRQIVQEVGTEAILVNGEPLVFFHFSGINPQEPHKISKHQNRFSFENINKTTQSLILEYVQALIANDAAAFCKLSYGFGHYADTTPITTAERIRFREDPNLRSQCGGQPFSHPEILSTRYMHANAENIEQYIDPTHIQRLHSIYQNLLGRPPEQAALAARGPLLGSSMGMARTFLSVGFSREARATPGWQARLLRLADQVSATPEPLKRYLIRPLRRTLEAVGQHAPNWAYHPPGTRHQSRIPSSSVRARRISASLPAASDAALDAPGINLIGYLRAELGVGEAARSLARACVAAEIPFSATEAHYDSQNPLRDTSILEFAQATRYAIDLLYVNADQTAITSQLLSATGRPSAGYTIGFWHWEQPELPAHLHAAFALLDEVWVPSTFVHDAIAPVSPVPVCKIPHALQCRPTPGSERAQFGLPGDKLMALVMYDFHSYQYRKNPQAAIAAYRLAAKKHPHLTLVIKTINSMEHVAAYAELRDSVQDLPNVFFIDEYLTRQQTWDLQSCCDILLSLHRAEGFGLAPAEMMHMGKSVIATGWSANMDFMTNDNSMPVRYQLKPLEQDLGAYPAGPLWAEADIEHAAWCLDQLASRPDLARQLGQKAAQDIRQQLSPQTVGRQIRQRLQAIGRWHPDLLN